MNHKLSRRAAIFGAFAALLLIASRAHADDRVGAITALTTSNDTIEIDNRRYRISSNALVGTAPDSSTTALKMKHLAVGQTVHLIASGNRITTLRVLHKPDEMPD